jgi:copper transport protein
MRAARWLLALAAAWAGGAAGHAGLVSSTPADGAALAAPPASIELRFTEPVTPMVMRLFAGSAEPVTLAAPQGASDVIKLALPANLREGLHTLSFRVISADSHPIGGSIVFAVGEHAGKGVRTLFAKKGPDPVSLWMTASRAVRDLALLIAAGGALFVLCIARFPAERTVLGAAGALAIVAAIAGIGLQGADMADTSFGSLAAWRTGMLSSAGLSTSVAVAGALLIAIAAPLSQGRARLVLFLGGAIAAIASLPLTGHAITAQPTAVAVAALAAHALAAAFWIGSLAALLALVGRVPSDVAVLKRFSRWGMIAVAVLVIAGVTFAVLQLRSLEELFGSRYGLLISGKAVLLLALLLLAALNRFRWLPRLARSALHWSIAGELALAACVIAITAVLVQTPPPHGFTQRLVQKGDVAEVSVTPARAGTNAIVVRFQDKDGQPFDPEEVLLEIGNEAAGVERTTRPIRRVGPGHYSREGSELAFPGVWTIEVHARLDASGMASFRSQVPIR